MLASLANTKTFLGITNNEKDAVLTMILEMASDYIESQCNRPFEATVNTNELHDGTGTQELVLNNFPIIIPPNVILQRRTAWDNTDSWETINASDYWVDQDRGIITRTTDFLDYAEGLDNDKTLSPVVFEKGKQMYRVTYTSGYATIPYDLQYACMALAGQLLNTRSATGIKSESLGDHSITFADVIDAAGSGMVADILAKYKDIPLAK